MARMCVLAPTCGIVELHCTLFNRQRSLSVGQKLILMVILATLEHHCPSPRNGQCPRNSQWPRVVQARRGTREGTRESKQKGSSAFGAGCILSCHNLQRKSPRKKRENAKYAMGCGRESSCTSPPRQCLWLGFISPLRQKKRHE